MMTRATVSLECLLIAAAVAGVSLLPRSGGAEEAGLHFTALPVGDATRGGSSRGVAWGDFDGDGVLDLAVANAGEEGQPNLVARGLGAGAFAAVRSPALQAARASEGAGWIDFDGDGDLDLFFANRSRQADTLLRNDGEAGLAPAQAGDLTSDRASSTTACWADPDADGDLDVFVVHRDGENDGFYENLGDGSFRRRLEGAEVTNGGDGRACAWGDLDGDGDLDLYVGNFLTDDRQGAGRNFLYRNDGAGRMVEVVEGPAVTDRGTTYGVAWGDIDDDGDLDLYVTNVSRSIDNALYLNDGSGNLERLESGPLVSGTISPSKGQAWGDLDNDGDLDLYVANGTEGFPDVRNFLFLDRGGASFARLETGSAATDNHISAGTALGDLDRDGDLDLYVANWGGNAEDNDLYRNESPVGHWLVFRLEGRRSNRMGVGSRIEVTTTIAGTEHRQRRWLLLNNGYGSQSAPELHFGLGDAERAERVTVLWPSGQIDRHREVAADRFLLAVEGSPLKPDPRLARQP